MSRRNTKFYPGGLYHVVNRGAFKMKVFDSTEDCIEFLNLLELSAKKYQFSILIYCLMPNHFHLLIRQDGNHSVSRFMRDLTMHFAKYYNNGHDKTGAVFQGRFWCGAVDNDAYLSTVVAYMHLNPVKARLCGSPDEWRYSNYASFLGITRDRLTSEDAVTSLFGDRQLISMFIADSLIRLRQLLDSGSEV